MNSNDKKFLEKWLNRRKSRVEDETYSSEQSAVTALKEYLQQEKIGLDDIEFIDADGFVSHLINDKGLSENTAINYYDKVQQLYAYYIKANKLNKDNPFDDVDINNFDYDTPSHPKIKLDEDEVQALIDSMPEMRAKALFSLQATTGARIGEVIRAKTNDIDLSERSAKLITLKNPKQDNRTVYFDRKTRRYLDQYQNKGYRSKYPTDDSEYLFITRVADRISRDRARTLFHKGVENCSEIQDKLDYNEKANGQMRSTITTHTLRRSFCQNWVDNGGDVMALKNICGWRSIETAKQYLSDDVDREKVDKYGVKLS